LRFFEKKKIYLKEWHKGCFKCKTCNSQLTLNTYKDADKEIYCRGCFSDKLQPFERNRKDMENAQIPKPAV
jgi:hypothetical protein